MTKKTSYFQGDKYNSLAKNGSFFQKRVKKHIFWSTNDIFSLMASASAAGPFASGLEECLCEFVVVAVRRDFGARCAP